MRYMELIGRTVEEAFETLNNNGVEYETSEIENNEDFEDVSFYIPSYYADHIEIFCEDGYVCGIDEHYWE